MLPELYRDLPLDPARKEIRVLTLASGDGDTPLECTLKTISLGDKSIRFSALSYVWGDPADTTIINVNNVHVPVTKSLAGALSSLKNCLTPRLRKEFIWADAICINQQDIAERTQQVRSMAEIYSTASHVIVWLGDGNQHTDLAISMMCSPGFRAGLDGERAPTRDEIKVDVVLKHDLCKRQWWQRLWVRQEFVLATRAWDYPELQNLWAECRKEVTGFEDDVPTTKGIHPISLDNIYRLYHRNGPFSLPYAVRYVLRNSIATNALDFIYGLLGLLQDSDRDRITLDYNMEPMELFQQVSNILWREHHWFMLGDLLPILEFQPDEKNIPRGCPILQRSQLGAGRTTALYRLKVY
ncbi:Heterokaryon incompatibility protein 6, OR allele [Madurella mycetomatis]|uniref:Heterokaryon incompatibility protein 6, OR allele n=1 Tax=Madurella mycetomatis TaxID=100816 RepID=A0A175W8Q7_9PEZI|nr:Heterokaryon incompatibility protein 6, OR allele [Madurella mycetomatis]